VLNIAVASKKGTERLPRMWAYYVTMAVDTVLLYVLNNLMYMNISALDTGRYTSCLWAINLALSAGLIGNFVFILYRSFWYHHFTQMMLNFLAVIAFFVIYRWFPFNVDSEPIQNALKIGLILAMIAPGVAGLVEMVRFIIAFWHQPKPPLPQAEPLMPIVPETSMEDLPPMASPAGNAPESADAPQPDAVNPPFGPEPGQAETHYSTPKDA
jgi:hypothetical protein